MQHRGREGWGYEIFKLEFCSPFSKYLALAWNRHHTGNEQMHSIENYLHALVRDRGAYANAGDAGTALDAEFPGNIFGPPDHPPELRLGRQWSGMTLGAGRSDCGVSGGLDLLSTRAQVLREHHYDFAAPNDFDQFVIVKRLPCKSNDSALGNGMGSVNLAFKREAEDGACDAVGFFGHDL